MLGISPVADSNSGGSISVAWGSGELPEAIRPVSTVNVAHRLNKTRPGNEAYYNVFVTVTTSGEVRLATEGGPIPSSPAWFTTTTYLAAE